MGEQSSYGHATPTPPKDNEDTFRVCELIRLLLELFEWRSVDVMLLLLYEMLKKDML